MDAYPYVFLDAQYEKVRHGGVVVSSAVLMAVGVDTVGKREVLGCSVKLSECESNCDLTYLQYTGNCSGPQ